MVKDYNEQQRVKGVIRGKTKKRSLNPNFFSQILNRGEILIKAPEPRWFGNTTVVDEEKGVSRVSADALPVRRHRKFFFKDGQQWPGQREERRQLKEDA